MHTVQEKKFKNDQKIIGISTKTVYNLFMQWLHNKPDESSQSIHHSIKHLKRAADFLGISPSALLVEFLWSRYQGRSALFAQRFKAILPDFWQMCLSVFRIRDKNGPAALDMLIFYSCLLELIYDGLEQTLTSNLSQQEAASLLAPANRVLPWFKWYLQIIKALRALERINKHSHYLAKAPEVMVVSALILKALHALLDYQIPTLQEKPAYERGYHFLLHLLPIIGNAVLIGEKVEGWSSRSFHWGLQLLCLYCVLSKAQIRPASNNLSKPSIFNQEKAHQSGSSEACGRGRGGDPNLSKRK